MQCVATSTPFIAAGSAALRRRALFAWLGLRLGRASRGGLPIDNSPSGSVEAATDETADAEELISV